MRLTFMALAFGLLVAPRLAAQDLLIRGATVYDGNGGAPLTGDVRVRGGIIAAIGALTPGQGETVVEARGLALAPGFIDTHSHADDDLADHPDALGAVSQGITTIVGGQDGSSPYPLAAFLAERERSPAALNLAVYAGHNTIRDIVLGRDFRRPATDEEVGRMRVLLRQELAAGALGLSTGLEYDPGIFSDPSEVLELARVTARAGGRYISHVRSEDRRFWEAIEEIITIGREAGLPVQVSHTKLAMRSLWGQADSLIARLDAARRAGVDITGDIYPYTYWHSTLTVLFPDRDYTDRAAALFAVNEVSSPEGLLLGRFLPTPGFSGRTLADVARELGLDPADALMELIRRAEQARSEGMEGVESVIGTSMTEPDIERLLRWPHMNFCTDGALAGRHPRGFGSYPRFLGRYVRERGVLSLAEAIRRATALAADHVGLAGRGRIARGQAADLVLFDPATVLDRATPADPQAMSAGIERVWVNGVMVFAEGAATGARPGQVLRRGAAPQPQGTIRP